MNYELIIASVTLLLSILAYLISHYKKRYHNKEEAKNVVLEAWDYLGDEKGSTKIYGSISANNIEMAKRCIDRALFLDKKLKSAQYVRCVIYEMEGDNSGAELCYLNHIKNLGKKDFNSYNNLGRIYQKQGRLQDSLELYKHAYQFSNKKSESLFGMGVIYMDLKDIKNALSCFEKANIEDKAYDRPYVNLLSIYSIRKEYDKAKEVLKEALANNIECTELYMSAAAFYKDIGEDELSKQMYNKYINRKIKS